MPKENIEKFPSQPLSGSILRLDQLRKGGAWINGSTLHLLELLRSGSNLSIELTMNGEEADNGASEAKNNQFDAALMATYADIISTAALRFGADFVSRAAENRLTSEEVSGVHQPDHLHVVVFNAGGARG